jgi:hypothetical protein
MQYFDAFVGANYFGTITLNLRVFYRADGLLARLMEMLLEGVLVNVKRSHATYQNQWLQGVAVISDAASAK